MMQLTALISVPNDWTKAEVRDILEAGLRAEVVIRWRKIHSKKYFEFPTEEHYNEVSVDRIKYVHPAPPLPPAAQGSSHSTAELAYNAGVAKHLKEKGTMQTTTEEKQPKLDRKTRGQVRRVVNKLRTVERRLFESSSNPNKKYETVVYQDGQVLCNCQGWTMKKVGKPRQCRHTAELIGDREVIDNGEYQFIAALVSHSPAPHSLNCANCGSEVMGNKCSHCGEEAI